ncbi:ATP-dependent endonuclease [Legionella tucsonensis]|uniref:Recombination protein F n=1 Tax=Legionella tucsonensis TaxID=40335 RepID=A0A0W0ZXA3_9GAMM|nr:AAA family ATPase [Legionella tucsonensis]KTD73773.1 recombination protein F [Legionella tucsonensis]
MQIAHIDIQNFRKLKACRVELSQKETIFVGANNSGKTSAMDALILFLKCSKRRDISTSDFTLSNWVEINKIAESWIVNTDENKMLISTSSWVPFLPAIDVWIKIEDDEIHYVSHLLPTLDWTGDLLGVRLIFEPKNIEVLYNEFTEAYVSARDTTERHNVDKSEDQHLSISLWPKSMHDFLNRELHKYFIINAYLLDPEKQSDIQSLPLGIEPLDFEPFDGLIKIDIINAQRGFSDVNADEGSTNSNRRLSSQLKQYYSKHLDPTELPDENDLDALSAIDMARAAFDEKLKVSFNSALCELEGLNYPGFGNPQIVLSSKVDPLGGLNHNAAVQFSVITNDDLSGIMPLRLPEQYNGLGYQNLISMVFHLIRFRDEWMRVGKAGKKKSDSNKFMEPLHLVLIEEPEAHLHAQVQQVFIKNSYKVLRNHDSLGDNKHFHTQMVVSTHSSHIAHEIDFTCLRYFKRHPAEGDNPVPSATVVNLTKTFGSDADTSKFATRYLKTTHCDLFFADAAILVEGPAERMLIPHFICSKFPLLAKSYISLLEIGGSHAHRLKPLIEALGLLTLVITDLDSLIGREKAPPEIGKNQLTGNETLKKWIPQNDELDKLLNTSYENKETGDGKIRVAYQYSLAVTLENNKKQDVIPYTFEDALVLSNFEFFRSKKDARGLMKKMVEAVNKPTLKEACEKMFEDLKTGKKAEMALELLYSTDPSHLLPPKYIHEGLKWLEQKISLRNKDYIVQSETKIGA